MMSEHVEQLFLRDASSGRWHEALVSGDEEPMVHDACNVTGDREYFGQMPEGIADSLLCKRCFGTVDPGPESQNDAP